MKPLETKVCRHCGKIFMGKSRRVFCSADCAAKHKYYEKNNERKCECCGKMFTANTTQRYCSDECRQIVRDRRKVERRAEKEAIEREKKRKALQYKPMTINRFFTPKNAYGERFKAMDNLTQDAVVARYFGMTYGTYSGMRLYEKEDLRKRFIREKC